jgi:hypothetical protein
MEGAEILVPTGIRSPDLPARRITMYSSPVTGLEWPRGFQEVKVRRFHDNRITV